MALDSITQMPNLPITQAFKASLPAAPKGRIGPKEIAPAEEELGAAISTATQKVGEADVNIEKAKRDEKARELEIKAESKKKLADEIPLMPERLAYKEAVKEERGMEFVPTRDTVQDIAGLFGLIGVVGMVIGKGNAMQAMGAMNGMMEGHRKGRQDLYKQELQQFEKNFKAMQAKVSAALAEYQEALKVKQQDSEAGELMAQVALARSESPLLKAIKDKQGDAAVLARLKEVNKSVTVDMPKTINDLQDKSDAANAAERRHREAMAQRDRIAKEQSALREKLATIAAGAKGQGTLKPGAKVTEGYIADNILKADVDGLVKDLNNPALQQQIKDNRIEAFLTEESKILNQVLAKEIPPELQQFLTKVRDIRNNYYLNISGKAVTGGEALRNYGTVPQPGDEPSVMVNKLAGMSGRISDSITLKKQLFGLPNLSLNPGTKPNLKPGEDYAVGSQPGSYELNQVITLGGKKYKVIGLDDPSDPDLEEIK